MRVKCKLHYLASFLLSFPLKLGGQNNVGPEGLFSFPFSVSLVFSPEPNKRKCHFPLYFPSSLFSPQPNIPLGSIWLGGWKIGWKSENIESRGRMEKWEDRKNFSFPHLCLVERVEKWRDEIFFGLVENKVCINLPSCPI